MYAFATVAPVLVALLVTPLVTRQLGAAQYGVVGVGISLYQAGAILFGVGLSAAITRHAIISQSGVSGAIALVYVGAGVAGSLAVIALVLLPLWGRFLVPLEASLALAWPIVSALGLAVLTLSQSVFRAQNRVVTFVSLGVISAVSGPVLGLAITSLTSSSATNYLCGVAIGHTATAVASLVLLGFPGRSYFRFEEVTASLRIGLPTVPHSIASTFLTTVVVVLASRLDGIETAGRVQLAIFLGTAPLMILGAFNNSWAPMIYRASNQERARLLSQSSQVISVIVFALIGGFCLLVEPVARFIAGPELYSGDLTRFALVVATATPFMALYLMNINEVFRTGRTGPLAFTTPSAAALAIGAALALHATLTVGVLAFAIVLPVFHLMMGLISIWLRSRAGGAPPRIGGALPGLAAALALPLVLVSVTVPLWASVLGVLLLGATFVFASRHAIAAVR
ncbi:lipopolysaccharide biosynthesis protein [Microbacterium profundi]|uniref:lipopolysaccharide biosynthesis protein n=1 Tax=Microbacterium profundi TaxID=450380 RepID=UPI00051A23CA|nr:oligosaccharide flippase family protein [Microbacterium profundi]